MTVIRVFKISKFNVGTIILNEIGTTNGQHVATALGYVVVDFGLKRNNQM